MPALCFIGYKKIWEIPCKKPYQIWERVKSFKKHQHVLTGIHKKRSISFHRFVDKCTLFLAIFLLFLKGEDENLKNWVRGGTILLKKSSAQKGKGEKIHSL